MIRTKKNGCRPGRASLLFILGIASAGVSGHAANLYLIGMGPGDPDLATVKAMRLVREADIIYVLSQDLLERFEQQLRGKDVRDLSGQSVTRYYTRKAKPGAVKDKGAGTETGDANRRALVRDVKAAVAQAKTVVFLDSGDPLIFGPWVWLLREFGETGMEVVPGVSSFNAGLAAVRHDPTWAPNSHSVILTADRTHSSDRLEALAAHRCSLVLFTHRSDFSQTLGKLKTQYPPETPVAIVFYAGYQDKQRVVRGTLESIATMIDPQNLPLEHIIFVGGFLTYEPDKE